MDNRYQKLAEQPQAWMNYSVTAEYYEPIPASLFAFVIFLPRIIGEFLKLISARDRRSIFILHTIVCFEHSEVAKGFGHRAFQESTCRDHRAASSP